MKKFMNWIADYGENIFLCFVAVFVLFLIVVFVVGILDYQSLTEGTVTDKHYFPGTGVRYSNGELYAGQPDKWIISVESGDKTDVWYVSENFYDSVHIGDWVTK